MNNLSPDHFYDEGIEDLDNASSKLPIFKFREEIIETVKANQFVIIVGGTGCGKTTQIPQYLYYDDLHENETIGITQPRRIAAVSMAERVAKEMKVRIGRTVGYEIRFDKKCGICSKIKYMTDGILLNESMRDKNLNNYRIIIIDEVHERSLNTDLLLALLKRIARRRKELKVIVSSATIDATKFLKYFETAKIINVESGLHKVDIIYYGVCSDYIKKAVDIVRDIHRANESKRDPNDILIFLTGEEDIILCCNELLKMTNVIAIPLCSVIDLDTQNQIFDPVRSCETKVIVATNIAETSITIEGITHVIDCGYVKQISYSYDRRMDELEDVKIARSQANQRKGRAGRVKPGVCHRLYPESTYNSFEEEAQPEIFRKHLLEISLKLVALNLKDIEFIDPPDKTRFHQSFEEMVDLGLIDSLGKLTKLGEEVVWLPIDPVLGKVLLTSLSYKCTAPVIVIVAMFSEKMKNIFRQPFLEAKSADRKRSQFRNRIGDHFTLLNVYNAWSKQEDTKKWCVENFIDFFTMGMADNTIKEIRRIFERKGWNITDDEADLNSENIQKCFVAGYFKNICIQQRQEAFKRVLDDQILYVNNYIRDGSSQIILYHEAIKSKRKVGSGVMQLDENLLRDNFKKELELIKFPENIQDISSF